MLKARDLASDAVNESNAIIDHRSSADSRATAAQAIAIAAMAVAISEVAEELSKLTTVYKEKW